VTPAMGASPIPKDKMNDPAFAPLAKEWKKADQKHQVLNQKLEKLKAKPDKSPKDFVDIAKTKDEVDRVVKKKQFISFKVNDQLEKAPEVGGAGKQGPEKGFKSRPVPMPQIGKEKKKNEQ